MNHTFSILFYIRKDKRVRSERAPIYLRITVNGKRAEQSIKRSIDTERWDSDLGYIKGNKRDAREINLLIDNLRIKVRQIHNQLIEKDRIVTSILIKDILNGVHENQKSLIDVFNYHNQIVKNTIGIDFAEATYIRYLTTKKHVVDFMESTYNISDIKLIQLNFQFISDFEYYLKTKRKCNHNSTIKYIKNFRKVINLAIKNEWIDKDPFAKYSAKTKEVKKDFLTQEELDEIYNKNFNIRRLDQVKDTFIFCCHTGLAYVDVSKLTIENISKNVDGRLWLFVDRQKTGNPSNVPLLPIAMEIIKKYKDDEEANSIGKLLPVLSNQKTNAYLKEIGDLCGIKKNITFHMARHTFATKTGVY
jgi:integrase